MPLTLAASSLPVGMGLSRVPFVCQAPKPFLPCEMNIAGKAEPKGTAVVVESPRVKTAMSPSEHRANDESAGAGESTKGATSGGADGGQVGF